MTLFTLSNLYAQDFPLHAVTINQFTICWDQNDQSLPREELKSLKSHGEKIEGASKVSPTGRGTNPSRNYINKKSSTIEPFSQGTL